MKSEYGKERKLNLARYILLAGTVTFGQYVREYNTLINKTS